MAPRICTSLDARQSKGQCSKAEFAWPTKFSNPIPELPSDSKFIPCPLVPLSRFAKYQETSLERAFKSQEMCDLDLGMIINIVEPDFYKSSPKTELHPSDQVLLDDESGASIQKLKRSAQHAKPVPFMRRTEYISSEFNRLGTGAYRQEIKVGFNLRKTMDSEDLVYRNRDSQIEVIEKTFDDAKKKVTKHHSKKGVTAVEEVFIFPDFKLWKHSFAQVLFDADPSYAAVPEKMRKTAMENGIIGGLENNEVGFFCPNAETIKKFEEDKKSGRAFDPEATYEFGLNREYTWEVRNKNCKNFEDDFVLYRDGDRFVFNELETRVKLQRKRCPAGSKKRKLEMQVSYRDETDGELAKAAKRMKLLEEPYDSDC